MPAFYVIEFEERSQKPFALDQWADDSHWDTMTLANDGTAWQLRNEGEMELGTAFQRGNHIYISWLYVSFGPRHCWLATQIVGELLYRGCKISLDTCSQERFNDAQSSES